MSPVRARSFGARLLNFANCAGPVSRKTWYVTGPGIYGHFRETGRKSPLGFSRARRVEKIVVK